MRPLTLAAVSAILVLSACSDQSPQTPTEPSGQLPAAAKASTGSCQVPFPIAALTDKTGAMFADASVRNAANAKIKSIEKQCGKGKVGNAQHEALTFVDWMLKKYGQSHVPEGTAVRFADLMSTLFVAVGLQLGNIDPGIFGPRGAVGVFIPGQPFDLKNGDGTAAIHLDGDAFDQVTLITIIPLPDSDQLVTDGEEQAPPFWDYNAANADGNHNVNGFAIIGFCIDDNVDFANPQIGHNPLAGGFEILEAASNGEYQALGLSCPFQVNNPGDDFSGLDFGGGLKAFARSAWKAGAHYARPVAEAIFVPELLHATALGEGGAAGRGSNISPFGEVDATYDNQVENAGIDPGFGGPYLVGEPIQPCTKDCFFPQFRILAANEEFVSGTINATLIPLNGSTGTLSGEPSETTTGEPPTAVFDHLIVSAPGTYFLIFAAQNARPYRTGTFTVEESEE